MLFNKFLQERNEVIRAYAGIGDFFVSVLIIVFILYANRFVMRRRRKEFALNIILGMEKKHLRFILLIETIIEYLIASLISIIGGYLFGILLFMLLNKLMKMQHFNTFDYPFNIRAMVITLIILFIAMSILYLINCIQLTLRSSLKLIHSGKAVEKARSTTTLIILSIIGTVLLVLCYGLALNINLYTDYGLFFLALLLVIVATYVLFTSLSILILRVLRRIPTIYYKKVNFFTLSNLLSRMKSNAVSLASISLLCTFLVVTALLSLSTYRGLPQMLTQEHQQGYYIQYDNQEHSISQIQKRLRNFERDCNKYTQITYKQKLLSFRSVLFLDNNKLTAEKQKTVPFFTKIVTENQLEHYNGKKLNLKSNQIGLYSANPDFDSLTEVELLGQKKRVKHLNVDDTSEQSSGRALFIVVKNTAQLKQVKDKVKGSNNVEYLFNVKNKHVFEQHKSTLENKYSLTIDSIEEFNRNISEIYGGLVFVGIIVSITLLVGIFLMMYYKQVSEGYDDQRNYQIMKTTGLDKSLIKQVINRQIIWIFSLPLLITCLHSLFATKLISQLLTILVGVHYYEYIVNYSIIMGITIVVYGLIYLLTSNAYFRNVNNEDE
ncbi:ABC transporter permease [Staphylococcus marylandisciuri]|uniref:ABC transporter permease n=1 Tax=Staphylococcus marylandisciuri TaxID=2981529 RepID=UPI0021CED4EA|nr:ABC transporter permease [Staphylococcus marylandisciuri]